MKKSLKKLGVHIGLMIVLTIIILFIIFNVYLPSYTRHGETITVPDLKGMKTGELKPFMEKYNLRYEVVDSSYDPSSEPGTVLSQRPKPESKVKENRKIYVNVNLGSVPIVKVPDLTMISLINARVKLDSLGLILDDSIRYRFSNLDGMVLGQLYKDEKIKPGEKVQQGSMISLVVGRKNLSTDTVTMIDVVGLPLSVAIRQLEAKGLEPLVAHEPESTEPRGTITRQNFEPGKTIKKGSFVDIWAAGEPPAEEDENEEEDSPDE